MPNKALDATRIPHRLSKRDKLTDCQQFVQSTLNHETGSLPMALARSFNRIAR